MGNERPVFWHQGLFLQPQHFQLTDRFHDEQLGMQRAYIKNHFWGCAGLQINEPGLGNKLFEIFRGEFLFPDGTFASYPGNAVIKARSFDEAWVEAEKPFTVYIGLYNYDSNNPNVTQLSSFDDVQQTTTRYASLLDPEDLPDTLGEGPPAKVKRMSYVIKIFWETEIREVKNCHVMPIAQLVREGDDVILSRAFIPPSLRITASPVLEALVKEIRDLVGSRCRQLEEYKSPKDLQGMELEIRYFAFLLALRSLNRYVPLFYSHAESITAHPWEVYTTIRQMLGELSTFSERMNAFCEDRAGNRLLANYDHENLWMCFSQARQLVAQMLESIMLGPEFLIRLEHDGEYYSTEAPDHLFDPDNAFWLALRTTMSAAQVLEAEQHVIKLSAAKNLTTLIARAVPGIPLEYHAETPSGMPRSVNVHYFKIDKSSSLWKDVERTRNISLYWDSAPEDLIAEIIVLRG